MNYDPSKNLILHLRNSYVLEESNTIVCNIEVCKTLFLIYLMLDLEITKPFVTQCAIRRQSEIRIPLLAFFNEIDKKL